MATLSPPKSLLTSRKQPLHDKASLSAVNLTKKSESKSDRIWLSDVIVKRPKNLFVDRKWHFSDMWKLIGVLMVHVLAMFAPITFTWDAFRVAVFMHVVIGMFGVNLSYHRNLTHRSFRLPKWLEYFFAYLGCFAFQEDPITWVSAHRCHHKFVDTERDPHSPIEGFWFSHINWLFDTRYIVEKKGGEQSNVDDLMNQTFYKFLNRTYYLHTLLALGLLLYALGGFPYFVWGMGVRSVWTYHTTFFVNSVCHIWGNQPWNTGDLSKNNWWVGFIAAGEGWHNNHHAFEYSARHGLEWWQVDFTWYVVKLLEALGLATDIKLPTEAHKKRMAF